MNDELDGAHYYNSGVLVERSCFGKDETDHENQLEENDDAFPVVELRLVPVKKGINVYVSTYDGCSSPNSQFTVLNLQCAELASCTLQPYNIYHAAYITHHTNNKAHEHNDGREISLPRLVFNVRFVQHS